MKGWSKTSVKSNFGFIFKMAKLNFGCGTEIKKGWDNVDIQKHSKINYSFDFDVFPYPLEDNYYEYILIHAVLENLLYPEKALNELWKKCKDGAVIEIICPYYNASWVYHDLKTRKGFNKNGFICLCNVQTSEIKKVKRFDLIYLEYLPTNLGKFIYPKWLREKLAVIFGGLISGVHVKLEVIK